MEAITILENEKSYANILLGDYGVPEAGFILSLKNKYENDVTKTMLLATFRTFCANFRGTTLLTTA